MLRFAKFIAPIAMLTSFTAANATAYVLNAVVNLSGQASSSNNYNVSNIQSSQTIANLVAGDTVSGTMTFANGQAFTINDAGNYEYVYLFLTGSGTGSNGIQSSYTSSFSGVGGSLIGTNFTGSSSGGFAIVGPFANLTNSAFSFTSMNYSLTVTGGSEQNVSAGSFSTSAGAIGAVPEPATWAMMIGGFGMVGAALRRSRRQTLGLA